MAVKTVNKSFREDFYSVSCSMRNIYNREKLNKKGGEVVKIVDTTWKLRLCVEQVKCPACANNMQHLPVFAVIFSHFAHCSDS